MTTERIRRAPHSWTTVRLPERDLSEVVLEVALPLLEKFGPVATIEDSRRAIDLAVTFWNASVLASKLWGRPRPSELNELRKRMRGRQASRDDAAIFDVLAERRRDHWMDPRLVETWTYEAEGGGVPRLTCTTGLPAGVKAEVPPPSERRIAIGGRFLDEVRISLGGNMLLTFPVEQHRGVVNADGSATIQTMMPAALQLFAEGRLPPVSSDVVEVAIGGHKLGSMVLAEVRCGESARHDVVALEFRAPSSGARSGQKRTSQDALRV